MTLRDFLLYSIICLLAHELGHILAARAIGVEVKRIGLGWMGMYLRRDRAQGWAEVVICLAGPGANLALALLVGHPRWLAVANLEFAWINLLPFPHSDGRHVWQALRSVRAGKVRVA